jgi:ribosomal protein S27AE
MRRRREKKNQMPSSSSRRPAVNPRPVGGSDISDSPSYEQLLKETCSRCGIRMTWSEHFDNLICIHCGFQPLKKEEKAKAEKLEEDDI